jgi:hypothetical protein
LIGAHDPVPGKTIREHQHPLHAPIPFTAQDGARPHLGDTLNQARGFLSCLLRRFRAIEQMPAIAIQIPESVGL